MSAAVFGPADEQRLVQEFFGDRVGFFVDVGANDPFKDSQSWHLERLGWGGLLIEPLPDAAERLRQSRRAIVVEVACTSPERANRSAVLRVAGPFSSLESDLRVVGAQAQSEIEVPTRTLDDVLRTHAVDRVDFVSIDVEGHELEVLRGFSVERYRPALILIEDHAFDLSRHRALKRRGYRLIRRTGLNAWYVPASSAHRLSPFGRWQLFRKYVLGMPFRRLQRRLRRIRAAR